MNIIGKESFEVFGEWYEWIDEIKSILREYNVSFESEESVRVHISDVILEIRRSEENYIITINIEIPKYIDINDIDRYVDAYRIFLEILAKASAEPVYELDSSIGYVFLRALINFKDLGSVISTLRNILGSVATGKN